MPLLDDGAYGYLNMGTKNERGERRRGVKTRRFSDWLKEGRKEFPLSRTGIIRQKCQLSRHFP